jgi:hypothetical protein
MKCRVKKETLRIRSVEDLYLAILYLDEMYGTEESTLTFPDGHLLVSLTRVRRAFKDGTETIELVFSDRWPKGAAPSKEFEIHRDYLCN